MDRQQKAVLKDEFGARFKKANAAVLAEYRGLTVAQLTDLRTKLRQADAEFQVVKNRIARIAIKEEAPDLEPIIPKLKGPVGVVYMNGDAAKAAKSLLDFEKENEKFVVTAGVMERNLLSVDDIKALASLPSREELLARIVGSLIVPHRNLMGVLGGVTRNFVQVMAAIRDKKEKQGA